MNHFLDTKETVAKGMEFPYFGKYYLLWLCGIAVTIAVLCLIYTRSDKKGGLQYAVSSPLLLLQMKFSRLSDF